MSEANVSATNQDAIIELTDGSWSYFVGLEPGDAQFQDGPSEPTVNLDRGRVRPLTGGPPDMRASDETPATGSFTVRLRSLSSTTATTIRDLVLWMASDESGASYVRNNWTSTHPYSDVRTITLKYHLSGVYRGVPDQTLVYDYVALRSGGLQEGNPSTLNVSWTAGVAKPRVE